ncbi:24819_t:CDS:1, partial [Gigaspora rosea]
MIKYPYEPKVPKRCKAADKVNLPNIEIPRKDKAQSIQLVQNLKSGYPELKITNSTQIKEKICVNEPK